MYNIIRSSKYESILLQMTKRFLSFTLWCSVLILLVSNENPAKKLYYFNDLKDYEGLELSHKPGIYEEDITVELKVPDGGRAELILSLIHI